MRRPILTKASGEGTAGPAAAYEVLIVRAGWGRKCLTTIPSAADLRPAVSNRWVI
jgi:hypothetical protein